MSSLTSLKWLDDVEDKDYEAAYDYLSLRYDPPTAKDMVRSLRKAEIEHRRANDILRACGREPLSYDDPGVRRGLQKVWSGKALSPILVVSFPVGGDIADGYHRVSVTYHVDPFAMVPLRIG